ncbi:Six-hairpin glycosidase [Artomyces pyxidatus]|uniref:Six-hairpin glycosidase n=1 Tax=Artomyces pyxidatus TaxID=48021 RepID=A0ACB8SVJ3_9AGAM|nr:Six-hairpin glycosidase [Artomyces pyxidatus]
MIFSPIFLAVALASQVLATSTKSAADDYFSNLIPRTKYALLHETTGPEAGAIPGVVAAVIPDDARPEWNVYWVRDACLVYDVWLNQLVSQGDTSLRPVLDDMVHVLVRSQQITSLAGNVFTGSLGEAVYYLDLDYILDSTARIGSPADDTQPFRAAILIKYADWLLTQNNGTWVADNLWPAINLDLQWISSNWNESSWDLWWPPVWGGSYWTASLQYRALKAGARLGRKIGRPENVVGYDSRASLILDYMQTFWNEKEGYMVETTITDVKLGRSGKGAAPLTVTIYNFDPTLGCDAKTFQPCSDKALSSLKYIANEFRKFFPVSQNIPEGDPAYMGFFLEDQFEGGQPQFFSSFNQAEQLYDALATWHILGHLEVTNVSLAFFQQFNSSIATGTYSASESTYTHLTDAIREWADAVVVLLSKATPADYVLPMSIDKDTGEPFGPRGMIRSLAAASSAHDTRSGMIPPSWASEHNTTAKSGGATYGQAAGQVVLG